MEVDMSQLPLEVRREVDRLIRQDWDLRVVKALEEQKRQARLVQNHRPRAMDGIGEMVMSVHPLFRQMHSLRRGRDTWDDEDWVRYFLKHSPECAVKATGTKIQVGYSGVGGMGKRVKTYG